MTRWLFALAALSTSVNAGPDETTKFLMVDPVTMLDWGAYRMSEALNNGFSSPGGGVIYNWDTNRILVQTYKTAATWDGAEKSCAAWIGRVRSLALVSLDGAPSEGGTTFAQMFTHYGFEKSPPETLMEDIDRLIEIRCLVGVMSADDGYLGSAEIAAPLVGKGYSVKKDEYTSDTSNP